MADLDLGLRIKAVVDGARQITGLRQNVDQLGGTSQRTGQRVKRAFQRVPQLASRARSAVVSLQGAFVALGGALALRELSRMTDQFAEMQNRLRLVTDSTEQLTSVQDSLFQIAQRTRNEWTATTDLYARLARSTRQLDTDQSDLLQVTETVNQAMRVSGANAQAAQAALFQLGQGMAAGALRGEELNSILEQTPRLARAIAEGMGVTIGELRELGAQGELTAERVFSALQSQGDEIEREFSRMDRTVGQALTQLRNDLIQTFGRTDVSGLTESIDDFRQILTDPGTRRAVVGFASAVVTAFGKVTEILRETVELIRSAGEAFGSMGEAFARAVHGVDEPLDRLDNKIDNTRSNIQRLREDLDGSRVFRLDPFTSTDELQSQLAEQQARLEELQRRREAVADLLGADDGGDGGDGGDAGDGGDGSPDDSDQPTPIDLGGGGGDRDEPDDIQQTIQALEREADTFRLSRQEAELYRLEQEGASEAQLARTRAAQQSIRVQRQYQEQLEAQREAEREAAEAAEERRERMEAEAEAVKDRIDPMREVRREMQRLAELRRAGLLSDDEFSQAALQELDRISEKAEQTGQDLNQFWVQAARSGQKALADFFFDPFKDGVDGMVDSFGRAMRRIAAEAAAAQVMEGLFGNIGSTGNLGGAVGDVVSAVFHGGGVVGEAAPRRRVSPLAFAGARRYHGGGLAGDEVPAILRRREEVITPDNPRHRDNGGLNGGGITVNGPLMVVKTQDTESFRRSDRQLARQAKSALQREWSKG